MKKHTAKKSGARPFFNSLASNGTPDAANMSQVTNRVHTLSPSEVDYFGDGTSQQQVERVKGVYDDGSARSIANPTKQ